MAKILLVEDNREEAAILMLLLRERTDVVDVAETAEQALNLLQQSPYEVLILDWELPGMGGPEICRQYRAANGDAAILMLTGRSDIDSKTAALDGGADDYVTKPYDFNELSARIRCLVRRTAKPTTNCLKADGIALEVETFLARMGQAVVSLTKRERAVLRFLVSNPNTIFSARALLEQVWSEDRGKTEDCVRSCIRHLRNKLSSAGAEEVLKTVPGGGYMVTNGADSQLV